MEWNECGSFIFLMCLKHTVGHIINTCALYLVGNIRKSKTVHHMQCTIVYIKLLTSFYKLQIFINNLKNKWLEKLLEIIENKVSFIYLYIKNYSGSPCDKSELFGN